jgi:osomolarity two-component system response regulator SSK1
MAIGELKNKLRAKFSRRVSITSTKSQSSAEGEAQQASATPSTSTRTPNRKKAHSIGSVRSTIKSRGSLRPQSTLGPSDEKDVVAAPVVDSEAGVPGIERRDREAGAELNKPSSDLHVTAAASASATPTKLLEENLDDYKHDSTSTTDFPTPNTDIPPVREEDEHKHDDTDARDVQDIENRFSSPSSSTNNPPGSQRPSELSRRQSLLPYQQTKLIKTLLETELPPPSRAANLDYFTNNGPSTISAAMVSRKIWVKRPGASATLVTIHEDDLVDDVRDMILKKYANSLGRNFDAPDVTLRLVPREQRQERTLGPEEPMGRTLDAYYPGGQTVDEALIIDVPLRRTPKPSPQPQRGSYYDEHRPAEGGSDYFPPMPVPAAPSPHLPNNAPIGINGQSNTHHPTLTSHSMSVLTTGHVPPLPSPGTSSRRHHTNRPRIGRQVTSSPSVVSGVVPTPAVNNGTQLYRVPRSRTHSSASEQSNAPPAAPPLPTPPAPTNNELASQIQRVATPPPRVSSPRPTNRPKRSKKANVDHPSLPAGMLNGAVPPINVLIVEDNIINLKLLEAFMKRLKVRWQTAMNGREAVNKWRAGGFHLVLMDIQLPIMSGLEATKEIRRLERLNSIGVFSSSASSSAPEQETDEPEGEDKLPSTVLFKSPVIIVALTASSLQSDRHEALAAGCNDFLTKVRHPLLSFLIYKANNPQASQLRLARTQGNGMGLHASTD